MRKIIIYTIERVGFQKTLEIQGSITKKPNNQTKYAINVNKHFSKQDTQVVNRYMEKCSASHITIHQRNAI
jgi:hypothetical protein